MTKYLNERTQGPSPVFAGITLVAGVLAYNATGLAFAAMDATSSALLSTVASLAWILGIPIIRNSTFSLCMWVGIIVFALSVIRYTNYAFLQIEFFTHYFFGALLMNGAQYVLDGDGGPIDFPIVLTFLGFGTSAYILSEDLSRSTYLAHLILDTGVMSIMILGCIHSLVIKMSLPVAASRLRKLRQFNDPIVIMCIGTTMMNHMHDTTVIGMLWHQITGMSMIFLSLSQFACELIHATYGPDAPTGANNRVCELARALTAFTYMLTGTIVVSMGYMLYDQHMTKTPRTLHESMKTMWHTETEAMALYVAINMWISGTLVGVLRALAPLSQNYKIVNQENPEEHEGLMGCDSDILCSAEGA